MKILFFAVLFFIGLMCSSQENINYDTKKDGRIGFLISKNLAFVKFGQKDSGFLKGKSVNNEASILSTERRLVFTNRMLESFIERKQNMKEKLQVIPEMIEPVLIYEDGTMQICNSEAIVQITSDGSIEAIQEFLSNKGIDNWQFIPSKLVKNQYILKVKKLDTYKVFELVNGLQALIDIEFAEPNFIRLMEKHSSPPNDEFYGNQWSIENQGYLGGIADADMDVLEAWSCTSGSGIKIAIIDEGVDLSHDDLGLNLLVGYDATDQDFGGAPDETVDDAHGTACGGIVAAVQNNNFGVSGVAYNSKILPIRVAYSNSSTGGWVTTNSWLADGITWAYQNGADILSNSWGGGSPSSAINNAINNAVNNGRSGKGCLVLFSSGNDDGNISYPATRSEVVAVGATSMCDERKSPSSCDGESWWGSNFGSQLDIVAPGVKIYTTDISGAAGYSSTDYTSNFNGTSSACPNAAAVAALILSVNSNFSGVKVREILEKSTDKISGYTYDTQKVNGSWNNEVGHGRVNAQKAVQLSIAETLTTTGPTLLCTTNQTYSVSNVPAGASVSWAKSSNLTIVSVQGSAVTVSGGASGQGWVQATITGDCGNVVLDPFDVWVGKPYALTNPAEDVCTNVYFQDPYILPVSPGADNYDLVSNSPFLTLHNNCCVPGEIYLFASRAGNYTLTLTTTNGCGNTQSIVYVTAVRCGGGGGFFMTVYPNPSTHQVHIEQTKEATPSSRKEPLVIEVYNTVQDMVFRDVCHDPKRTIDVSRWKAGTYYLRLMQGDKEQVERLEVN